MDNFYIYLLHCNSIKERNKKMVRGLEKMKKKSAEKMKKKSAEKMFDDLNLGLYAC